MILFESTRSEYSTFSFESVKAILLPCTCLSNLTACPIAGEFQKSVISAATRIKPILLFLEIEPVGNMMFILFLGLMALLLYKGAAGIPGSLFDDLERLFATIKSEFFDS